MEIEFLGTGTSTGVPQIGCNCKVCKSNDLRNKRLRTSAIIHFDNNHNILIDCGPDFRTQILRARYNTPDALLVTHSHYDHVGGIDDLRPFCACKPFPVYARKDVLNDIRTRLPYCFLEHTYPGVPTFEMKEICESDFYVDDIKITPLPIWHYKLLISGFLIGKIAYITDAKYIDDNVIARLKGIPLLVINSLRISEHMSHMSLAETLSVISKIQPEKAYLIHMSHDMGLHEEASKMLPSNVRFAYDGLILKI